MPRPGASPPAPPALASSVQIGFVLGTGPSALSGLGDRVRPTLLFCLAALIASASSAAHLRKWPTICAVGGSIGAETKSSVFGDWP
jgi:hypothetical protein